MVDLPDSWRKSDKPLRAIQLAFEFNETISRVIRQQANEQGLSASDQIRSIIGLEAKKPQRPRLTVSLSEADYEQLGKRYNLSPTDKTGIRKAIAEELIAYSEVVEKFVSVND